MFRLSLMGDLLLGGLFSQRTSEWLPRLVPDVAHPFLEADAVFANLECPCSNRGEPIPGKNLHYCFPQALEALTRLNVTIVSLANNHILDYGMEAVDDSISELERRGIQYAGVGRNLAEARRPALVQTDEGVVAFLCFSWTSQWRDRAAPATADSPGVNPWSVEAAEQQVHDVHRQFRPRLVVVSVHWGEGKSTHPRPDSVREARRVVDAGADLIVGHHTHCLQTGELHDGKPIFYSLGNFIASPFHRDADRRMTYDLTRGDLVSMSLRERKTLLAGVSFSGRNLANLELLPLVQSASEPVLQQPSAAQAHAMLRTWHGISRKVSRPGYASRYLLYRRYDELLRYLEEVGQYGLRDVTWSTPSSVLRKLISGENMA